MESIGSERRRQIVRNDPRGLKTGPHGLYLGHCIEFPLCGVRENLPHIDNGPSVESLHIFAQLSVNKSEVTGIG